jgi:hypothetical protein
MAEPSDLFASVGDDVPADIEMGGEELAVEIDAAAVPVSGEGEGEGDNIFPFENGIDIPPRTTYVDYLKSPVIGLLVGQGDEQALLTAHQALLASSPWFADACAKFSNEVSVCIEPFNILQGNVRA